MEQLQQEAESILKEEIDKTRQMEQRLVESLPDMFHWKNRMMEVERLARDWERQYDEERTAIENEQSKLKARREQIEKESSRWENDRERSTNLEGECHRLMAELRDAQQAESDSLNKVNLVNSRLNPIREQVEQLRRFINDLELAVANESWKRAKIDFDSARQELENNRLQFSSLNERISLDEEKLRKLAQTAAEAADLKRQALVLSAQHEKDLTIFDSRRQVLHNRRDEVSKQISELLKQQDQIDRDIKQNDDEIFNLQNEISCLHADEQKADVYMREIQDLRSNVEAKVNGTLNNITNFYSPKIADQRKKMEELERYIADLKSKLDSIQAEEFSNQRAYEDNKQLFDSLNAQLSPLEEEMNAAKSILLNSQNLIRMRKDDLDKCQRQLGNFHGEYDQRIQNLHEQLGSVDRQANELQVKLAHPRQLNPYNPQLQEMMASREEAMRQAIASLREDPPKEMIEQLSHETEALMRAQLASGILSRQKQLEDEAKDLATVKAVHNPRFNFDNQAKERLLGEHLENSSYSRITNVIADLTEQKHIVAS